MTVLSIKHKNESLLNLNSYYVQKRAKPIISQKRVKNRRNKTFN